MRELENEFIKYWVENGILFSEYKEKVELDLEKMKEVISMRHKISNNEKQFWCYNLSKVKSISKEARDYADLNGQDFLYGTAVIVNSHITMFIFNIFLRIKNPRIPFQAFKNKEMAIEWLEKLKKENRVES